MLFNSSIFIFLFGPLVILLHYWIPKAYRNVLLLIASLIFYGWGEPRYVLVMTGILFITWLAGKHVQNDRETKWIYIYGILILANLIVFKYTNFFLEQLGHLGIDISLVLTISLPIGISFYTFQCLSYLIDLKRGEIDVCDSFVDLGTYIAMFPQLIAGPIVRYKEISREIKERVLSLDKIESGLERFIIGLAKKVIIADQFAVFANYVFNNDAVHQLPSYFILIGLLCYTFQIYFDFSGYSDMAIGLGKMLGFRIPENFNYPYTATSIRAFWRKWHITLSTWFRDYVYIPLGGSKLARWKTYRNLFIVFFVTGLWHGAGWNFIIWGLIHGIFIVIERLVNFDNLRIPNVLKWMYTFSVAVFAWLFFRVESFSEVMSILQHVLSWNQGYDFEGFTYFNNFRLFIYGIGICLAFNIHGLLMQNFSTLKIKEKSVFRYGYKIYLLFVFCLCLAIFSAKLASPFIYFRF